MGQAAPGATSRPRGAARGLAFPLAAVRGRFGSLRVRLMSLVVLSLVPAVALIVYFAVSDRQDAREQAQEDALTLTQLSVLQQQQVVDGSRQLITSLASLTGGADLSAIDPVQCQAATAMILQELSFYANFGAALPDGTVICTAAGDATAPHNITDRPSFQTAVSAGTFGVGKYTDDPISGKQILDISYPIYRPDGSLNGVYFLDLDVNALSDAAGDVALPGGAVMAIVDRNGIVLSRLPAVDGVVGTPFPDQALISDIATRGEGVTEATGVDGVKRLYGYTRIDNPVDSGLAAVVGIPTSEAYASVNRDLGRNLFALGIVGVLALAAAWFGSDLFVLRQTRRLVAATDRVAGGDFSARSGMEGASGELGALAQSFDAMGVSLQNRETDQKRIEADLRQLNESLEDRIAERTAQVEKHAQELRQSNAELEDFTYVVSHDLKEPLRGIEAFSSFLAEDYGERLDEEGRRYVSVIRQSAVRMKELIEKLLELSRVGKQTGSFETVPLRPIIEGAAEDLQFALQEKHAELKLPAEYPTITCGPVRIKEVFKNLISNAVKFNDKPHPVVEIAWERAGQRADDDYRFTVSDNGIGIDPKYQDKVFQLFQRLERRENYPGSGAGLTICKKIIESHGGSIGLESEPGKGTTFWFTLPARGAETQAEQGEGATE